MINEPDYLLVAMLNDGIVTESSREMAIDEKSVLQHIRENIEEWRKGCSCAPNGQPEECPACTRALIDAIDSKVGRAGFPKPAGCRRRLAPGQWWNFCGETDMGQTLPALCTDCGGELKVMPD